MLETRDTRSELFNNVRDHSVTISALPARLLPARIRSRQLSLQTDRTDLSRSQPVRGVIIRDRTSSSLPSPPCHETAIPPSVRLNPFITRDRFTPPPPLLLRWQEREDGGVNFTTFSSHHLPCLQAEWQEGWWRTRSKRKRFYFLTLSDCVHANSIRVWRSTLSKFNSRTYFERVHPWGNINMILHESSSPLSRKGIPTM